MIKITKLTQVEDVYDITVQDNHNFFADGILVHNCAEISLKPNQFCNLTTINASNITSQEDFNERARVAAFIGTLQASYTDFHYLRDVWRKTTEKDALLGVSMTGIASGEVFNFDISEAAKVACDENERLAAILGINKASRVTTVKPEGTASLVLGTSSGIHAWHNEYYFRRIRLGKNEPIYTYLKENHPQLLEDDFFKPTQQAVVSIPQKSPEGAITRTESALDLLGRVKTIHSKWIKLGHRKGSNTHNVSATVSIKDNEWDTVGEWMWENRKSYTALSVLPFSDHTYVQAPFEDITEEQYLEAMKSLSEVDLSKIVETDDLTSVKDEVACGGGACEVI